MQVKLTITAKRCRLRYGEAPCMAAGEAADSCYNTQSTCQDLANIDLADQQFIFGTSNAPLADSVFGFAGAERQTIRQRNTISSASIKSGRLELEGVASENTATIKLADEQGGIDDHDPYASARVMPAAGSAWGRWLARDAVLQRSEAVLEYRETDADRWVQTYWLVDEITHPLNGQVGLKLVDRITRRLDTPYPSEPPVPLAVAVDDAVQFQQGDVPDGHWRISSEVVRMAGGQAQRGQIGTQAAAHDIQDSMSLVKHFSTRGWANALDAILLDFFGDNLPAHFTVLRSGGGVERNLLSRLRVQVQVVRVSKLIDVLAELCMAGQVAMFVDIHASELTFRNNVIFGIDRFDIPESDIIDSPAIVKTMPKLQRTRVSIKHKLNDPTDNRSYQEQSINIEHSIEGNLGYSKGDSIENRFVISGDATTARRVQRYSTMPIEVKYKVRTADYIDLKLSDQVGLNYSEAYQSVDGRAQGISAATMEYAIDLVAGKTAVVGWVINRFTGDANTFNLALQGIEESVHVFNRVGQPAGAPSIVNITIADNTLIGGIGGIAALYISGFTVGSTINITAGRNVNVIGAGGQNIGGITQHGKHAIFINGRFNVTFSGSMNVCGGGGHGQSAAIEGGGIDGTAGRSAGGNGFGYLNRAINRNTVAEDGVARDGAGGAGAGAAGGGGNVNAGGAGAGGGGGEAGSQSRAGISAVGRISADNNINGGFALLSLNNSAPAAEKYDADRNIVNTGSSYIVIRPDTALTCEGQAIAVPNRPPSTGSGEW